MKYKYEYTTVEDRQALLDLYQELILVEEQNIIEGNFLVFSDEPISLPQPWEDQIADLKTQNSELMLAVAELASANEADKIETQLAIAELASIVTGGIA